ncbi:MAG: cell division ATP-binding protein FtsE [Bacillota bacterium]|nr:cell division ATP-binding protein FtsE [Bacillota bacterium]
MIEFDNASLIYQTGTKALDNVSFKIEKGEFVYLTGKSGAGKSSLMKLLMREENLTSGRIYVDSVEISSLTRNEIPYLRRSLGMVYQDFKLLRKLTVFENVAFAMQIVGASQKAIRHRVPIVLDQVGLSNKARSAIDNLSGGEQQRVSIARALVNKPTVILADEPTGNLDLLVAMEIMDTLESINRSGTTVLMATHAAEIVNSRPKRLLTIDDGQLVRDVEGGVYHLGD